MGTSSGWRKGDPGDGTTAVPSSLLRLGGLVALAGGALLVASALLALFVVDYSVPSEAASTAAYRARTVSLFFGGVLVLGGLVALHARQARAAGAFGLVAFLLAFGGMAASTSVFWSEAFLAPVVAREAPALLDSGLVLGERHGANAASYALGSAGWLLFGLAALRAGVYPRPAAALLVAGALVSLAQSPASEAVIALGVAWLGLALLAGTAGHGTTPKRDPGGRA
jgi:hypothetical protein